MYGTFAQSPEHTHCDIGDPLETPPPRISGEVVGTPDR
jgi:hypothetical protein